MSPYAPVPRLFKAFSTQDRATSALLAWLLVNKPALGLSNESFIVTVVNGKARHQEPIGPLHATRVSTRAVALTIGPYSEGTLHT